MAEHRDEQEEIDKGARGAARPGLRGAGQGREGVREKGRDVQASRSEEWRGTVQGVGHMY